jgi:hypothetical protein
MAILTINQYIDTIDSFVNNVKNSRNSYYVFYGKVNSWTNSNSVEDDTAVPVANSSVYSYEQSIYTDLVFGKLITSNDITYMIPRYNWTSGNIYDSYNQFDPNLYDKKFYVITDAYEVYKCIYNNNGGTSTVKPALTSVNGVFNTSDGYVWKYMFTLQSNANTKFTSTSYIPVTPNTYVINNAIKGSIDFIKVTNGGNNYQAWHSGYLQNFQDNYTLQIANTASPISGRYINSSIYLKTGYGSGQIRKIINYSGLNRLVTVSQPFDVSTVLNVTGYNGSFTTGLLASQRIDYISFLYQKGYFNIGDQIVQSDTVATANVIAANVTQLKVIKSSANDFVLNLPFYNASQSGVLKSGTVDVKTNTLSIATIINPGSGYNSNSTIIVANSVGDTTGTGATANAHANSSGRIDLINITNRGSAYTLNPTITIAPPAPIYFNANSSVNDSTYFITLGSNGAFFADGDYVKYLVATGNSSLTNLANNNNYYVVNSTSTGFKLSASLGGAAITLTKGKTEAGHSFTGQAATANSSIATYFITANSGTSFTSEFTVGDYIRVGTDTGTNIRQVAAVNTTSVTVNYPLTSNLIANSVYSIPYAAMPTSIVSPQANGIISNTNLNSVTLNYNNSAINSLLFTVGERVDMVGIDNLPQGANGIVSYCNTTAVILSSVQGSFATSFNNFIRGVSSLQKSNIISIVSFPNITISSPQGNFIAGQQIYIKTLPDLNIVGNATLVSSFRIPNELTEYIISPAVTIDGDGTGALAYSVVNTTFLSANEISSVVVLNPGNNYTYANISITSNTLFGEKALSEPIISPLSGHGYNAYKELGARYAGISMTIDTGENESYKFPVYGSYRKIGIIENPLFEDATARISSYDRINLTYRNRVGSGFLTGEYVVQTNSSAAGIIAYTNSTFMQLKTVKGNFVQNISKDDIKGLTSGTTANVSIANTVQFIVNGIEVVSETTSNVSAQVVQANSSTLKMTNVSGKFDVNDTVYDPVINAYANVTAIYTVNNTVDSSSNFGLKFSQVARVTLTSNTGSYTFGETVTQDVTNASGSLINSTQDIDIQYNNANGIFNVGNQITDGTSGATAIVTYANTTYLRLTSKNGTFSAAHRIINNVNIGADITNVYPVLVLNNIKGNKFQTGTYTIVGNQSGAVGKNQKDLTIVYPELVRNTGSVVYIENVSPVTRTATSKEKINLVIKF